MSPGAPASPELAREAEVFAALGDPTRLALLARLSGESPLSITRLTADASVSRQAITRHLQVLAAAGLVHGRKQGRERLWELNRERVGDAQRALEQIGHQWDDALGRLQRFVEE